LEAAKQHRAAIILFAGTAALAGKSLMIPRPRQPAVDIVHVSWHHRQLFEGPIGVQPSRVVLD
jgi:hypothetical protein